MSLLADLLSTLIDRRLAVTGGSKADDRPIETLCRDLVGNLGEVTGFAMACQILDRFQAMDPDARHAFFTFLNDEMDIDPDAVAAATTAYAADRSVANFRRLMRAAEAPRQELARRLNQVPGATARIVAMREDLLRFMKTDPALAKLDADLRHLLSSWFNRGFLVLRPINWESPAHVLEKIIAYEAVHAIDSWDDLRRRLQPRDRRCFGFFHPAMPDEPLIFVEVALTKGIPGSIQSLLSEGRDPLPETQADTAVFYSISNCQAGLAGISFGNSLIKQVARDLSGVLPQISTFVTLSPIPGLMKWLAEKGLDDRIDDPEAVRALATQYLLGAKREGGLPRDPVARFHLNNGASVHEVHARADLSANGLAQSAGAMVNYLYDLDRITENHEAFAKNQVITASAQLRALARKAMTPAT
ncbi:malonyl-CoA decarboxylase domain-containing protein [Anianabacter salinae]|uniref:malonyl-CoA decarboxylase domain-containing protein n=1 Tax=Anianabacter salinae TaxID=2851023 RepID=UPI00225E3B5D|nr:malonyl-CoA decarboxylase family protein [Anianabacter salinae]MBV0912408.1 malonyl-CoA decarboxylase [Anianabacter salinae]